MLLELHVPFDVLDSFADFSKYKVLILPDEIALDAEGERKLKAFVAGGGKIIASWHSAMGQNGEFALDFGVRREGEPGANLSTWT